MPSKAPKRASKRTGSESRTRRVSPKRKTTKRTGSESRTRRVSPKRKTTKRKSSKQKSPKRVSKSKGSESRARRVSPKRKTTKRKTPKRKTTKRKTTKRKTTKRKTPKRKTTKRKTTKRKSSKRVSKSKGSESRTRRVSPKTKSSKLKSKSSKRKSTKTLKRTGSESRTKRNIPKHVKTEKGKKNAKSEGKGMEILTFGDFRFTGKIAGFDFDWTLVKPKSGGTFPRNREDWEWLRPNVPDVLRKLNTEGYSVTIFTNQTKGWKLDQIKDVFGTLDIPVRVAVGLDKSHNKPSRIMFDTVVGEAKWSKEDSFFVGDALGRKNDWSDTDALFAKKVGLRVISPEEMFPFEDNNHPRVKTVAFQELVIMVGYPGSGKSTIAREVFGVNDAYIVLHGDDLKTQDRIVRETKKKLEAGKSVVVDATNPSKEKRRVLIDLAKSYNVPVRCVHVSTSMEESLHRNEKREKVVPKIAYYMYRKKFEEPDSSEGCVVVVV